MSQSEGIKLFAINAGTAALPDFGAFSDIGYFDGVPHEVRVPSYLIMHPKGNMIWEAGNGTDQDFGFMQLKANPIAPQLEKIGLTPKDIDYLAFSHLHIDHIGEASTFKDSTWIMNTTEWDTMKDDLGEKALVADYETSEKVEIQGDHDVFGDGTVQILFTPGHTHGHQSLLLRLQNAGNVILCGDAFHQRETRTARLVPSFNTSRADTLASMERLEGIVKYQNARLVIQHDKRDFAELPEFPAYLD